MKSLLAVLPILACCTTAFAQQRAVDRAVATTQGGSPQFRSKMPGGELIRAVSDEQAPELYPGELLDVGPQFLVARPQGTTTKGEKKVFEGYFDTQLYYTSNALLTEKGNQDTSVMVMTLQAAFNLPEFELAGGTVSPRFGYRHQWWMYSLDDTSNQLNNFDFAVGTVFLGFRHAWGENWAATASVDYNRYLAHEDDWNEFYVELAPNWSLERYFSIGEKGLLTLGYYGSYHWTQTDPQPTSHINDRLDSAFGVSYTQELLPKLFIQPYYRIQWSHYTENSDRNDMYNNLGLTVIYAFNDWASVRAFVNYENRNSTDDTVPDYGKWDSGGGLTFSAQF